MLFLCSNWKKSPNFSLSQKAVHGRVILLPVRDRSNAWCHPICSVLFLLTLMWPASLSVQLWLRTFTLASPFPHTLLPHKMIHSWMKEQWSGGRCVPGALSPGIGKVAGSDSQTNHSVQMSHPPHQRTINTEQTVFYLLVDLLFVCCVVLSVKRQFFWN